MHTTGMGCKLPAWRQAGREGGGGVRGGRQGTHARQGDRQGQQKYLPVHEHKEHEAGCRTARHVNDCWLWMRARQAVPFESGCVMVGSVLGP